MMFANAQGIRRDPLGFLHAASRDQRPVVPINLGFDTLYLINDPDLIRYIFQKNDRNYVKGRYYRRIRPFLGDGLFTVEGVEWGRQRRIAQPFFNGPAIANFAETISSASMHALKHYYDGETHEIELLDFFSHITLTVAIRCFIGPLIPHGTAITLAGSLSEIMRYLENRLWSPMPMPYWLPTPANRNFRRHVQRFDDFLFDMIRRRDDVDSGEGRGLLVDTILETEGNLAAGDARIKAVREQMISILVAAFETSALALTWSTVLLARSPETCRALEAQAMEILGQGPEGNIVGNDAIRALDQAEMAFSEALRLYPPAWCFSRELVESDRLGDISVPSGATIVISPFIFHRKESLWPDPERFDYLRFAKGRDTDRHPYAYFPFAGGRHSCIGGRFAMSEGIYLLSVLCKDFEITIDPDMKVEPMAATTLRPKNSVYARIKCRTAHA
ncbi:MAG: cytochrome P450 [Rhodothalassiaceae bacterium]